MKPVTSKPKVHRVIVDGMSISYCRGEFKFTDTGKPVPAGATVGKAKVQLAWLKGPLRTFTHNKTKYAYLRNGEIISLSKTNKGKVIICPQIRKSATDAFPF